MNKIYLHIKTIYTINSICTHINCNNIHDNGQCSNAHTTIARNSNYIIKMYKLQSIALFVSHIWKNITCPRLATTCPFLSLLISIQLMLILAKLRECGYTIKLAYQSSFIITTAVPITVI